MPSRRQRECPRRCHCGLRRGIAGSRRRLESMASPRSVTKPQERLAGAALGDGDDGGSGFGKTGVDRGDSGADSAGSADGRRDAHRHSRIGTRSPVTPRILVVAAVIAITVTAAPIAHRRRLQGMRERKTSQIARSNTVPSAIGMVSMTRSCPSRLSSNSHTQPTAAAAAISTRSAGHQRIRGVTIQMIRGRSGFRVHGSGFRVQGSRFTVEGAGFRSDCRLRLPTDDCRL